MQFQEGDESRVLDRERENGTPQRLLVVCVGCSVILDFGRCLHFVEVKIDGAMGKRIS